MKRPDTSAIRARLADPKVTTRELYGALIHCMKWIEHLERCAIIALGQTCDSEPSDCYDEIVGDTDLSAVWLKHTTKKETND
jgi:hypothetical protein